MAGEDGAAEEAGGILGVGQAGAVGEVCGGSRRGMSWGDAARSRLDDEAGEFPRLPRRNHSERRLG